MAAAGILLAALFVVRAVLVPFVLALLLTYLLNPPVTYLSSRGIPRPWGILLLYGIIAGMMAGMIVWIVPAFLREVDVLVRVVPEFTAALEKFARGLQADYARVPLPESLRAAVDETISGLETRFIGAVNAGIEGLMKLFPILFDVVIAPVLAFYILCDIDRFKEGFVRLLPKAYRSQLISLGREIDSVVHGFIMGQVTVAVVEGLLVGLVMVLLGLKFAVLVALIYAAAELIPYFGPFIGAIPALASAALVSPAAMVKLGVALILIQQLEASVLAPYLIGSRLGLHPLVVIFSLLVGGHFYGVVGLLLSVPVAALLRVIGRFALRVVEREKEGIPDTSRPKLTKVRSWRIVSTKIARPLARPESKRGERETGGEGKE